MTDNLSDMAAAVAARAKELDSAGSDDVAVDPQFVRDCLDANERGDGCLFAHIHRNKYLYNTTVKDGEWYRWAGNVWEIDDFKEYFAAVERVAVEYDRQAIAMEEECSGLTKKDDDYWKVTLMKSYKTRAMQLRSENRAKKALFWAPIVATDMACKESDFDRKPWLLPCANGVIDLKTGVLMPGDPADRMTRAIPVAYDPHADTSEWERFVEEIAGSKEVAEFLQRYFGYSITGHSFEQYIAVFIGSGRNGKGVLFSLLAAVLGPYYHVISPAMITEQKVEPSVNSASEHKYALMGKRLVVAGESKRGQRVDAGQVKSLTGDDAIECRPNFGKQIVFNPTHTLAVHTNHMMTGLGGEFSLIQRLLKIDFPWSYVDDPEYEAKKFPAMADRFRQKDNRLKDKFMADLSAILTWLVKGCLWWCKSGLLPPPSVLKSVDELAKEEDYIGEFITDCLIMDDSSIVPLDFPSVYLTFVWWWTQNRGDARKAPSNRSVSKSLRERGFEIVKKGGRAVVHGVVIHPEITGMMVKNGG